MNMARKIKYVVVKIKRGYAVQNQDTSHIVFTADNEDQALKVATTLNGLN